MRAGSRIAVVAAALLAPLVTTGCDGTADSSPPTRTVTVTASPSSSDRVGLRTICAHVEESFRDGDLEYGAQEAALATELQGMIDLADADAAKALTPLRDAAQAIADEHENVASASRQKAFNEAYDLLAARCRAAGRPLSTT